MKIVVIGGNGLIGKKLVKNLREQGHEVVAASRSSGFNTMTGEGLAEALAHAQVVVDVANSPSFEDKAAMEFFLNDTIELAGPKQIRLDELVRLFFKATHDSRKMTTDANALYYGLKVDDTSLIPSHGSLLGPTRFEDWIKGSLAKK